MKTILKRLKKMAYFWVARYFLFWAGFALRRWHPKVIVVTGSVGKTTLLNILDLEFDGQAHVSHNANSVFGLAFDVVGEAGIKNSRWRWLLLAIKVPVKALYFRRQQKYYIAEVDADRPFEANLVTKWLKPSISLWTSLSNSHAINFESTTQPDQAIEAVIAKEFAKVIDNTTEFSIVDADNNWITDSLKETSTKIISVSFSELINYEVGHNYSRFEFKSGTFEFSAPQPKQLGLQLALTTHLLNELGIEIIYDLRKLDLPPGRSSYFKGIKGVKIIDSSYNAHMESMVAILAMFEQIAVSNKWLVIGDIIEQGNSERRQHRQLADELAKIKADKYILLGKRTAKYTFPKLKQKVGDKALSFTKPADCLDFLKITLSGNELVLFKGSQFLEGLIKNLLADPRDANKLCRRDQKSQQRRLQEGIG